MKKRINMDKILRRVNLNTYAPFMHTQCNADTLRVYAENSGFGLILFESDKEYFGHLLSTLHFTDVLTYAEYEKLMDALMIGEAESDALDNYEKFVRLFNSMYKGGKPGDYDGLFRRVESDTTCEAE